MNATRTERLTKGFEKPRRRAAILLAIAALWLSMTLPVSVVAQDYTLDSFDLEPVGGEMSGEGFSLVGSVDLIDAEPSSGDGFSISGSLSAGLSIPSSGGIPMILITGLEDAITISWVDPAGSFVLQECDDLTSMQWQDVTGGDRSPVSISPDAPMQFFRLVAKP